MRNEVLESINKIRHILRKAVDENNYVDIGSETAATLGVRLVRFRVAVQSLVEDEGYTVHYVAVDRDDSPYRIKVLTSGKTTYQDVYKNLDKVVKIKSID